MKKWQYMTVQSAFDIMGDPKLNHIGSEGWELVQVMGTESPYFYIFKKPLN